MNKVVAIICLWGILIMSIFATLDYIGGINQGLDPKKHKQIDISKKKIFIPYHDDHFFKKNLKGYLPPFEGTVFLITYVLTLIAYIHFFLSIALSIVTVIFWSKITIWCLVAWVFSYVVVIGVIFGVTESSAKKRTKKEPPDFRMD